MRSGNVLASVELMMEERGKTYLGALVEEVSATVALIAGGEGVGVGEGGDARGEGREGDDGELHVEGGSV
jgi:hypothetical protein